MRWRAAVDDGLVLHTTETSSWKVSMQVGRLSQSG
jgi:hypothetical protein